MPFPSNDSSYEARPAGPPGPVLGTGRLGRPRRAGLTVLAAALLSGLLGSTPDALADPRPGDTAAPTTPDTDPQSTGALPPVWPRPQTARAQGAGARISDQVTLMAEQNTDPYTLEALRTLLRGLGARTVVDAQPGGTPPPDGLIVYAGGRAAEDALRTLGAPPVADLPSGGYRLATGQIDGRPVAALSGMGPDGLFHAAQTLRQLAVQRDGGRVLAGAVVRDWPVTAVRGLTEGFYGDPWTHEQRLAQLDFLGRTKQNRYLYAPGDDPYRQARWRAPYPAAQRAEFRDLADRARRNHVTLGWAVAPGQAMCFSSGDDLKALKRKVDAMWALGVRAFQLQFQDVSYTEWHCGADRDAFGSGPKAAAKAQAKVANALAAHLAAKGSEAAPLSLLPTEYYQDGRTDFRRALADALDPRVEVAWTGVGVVPRTITGAELADARSALGHPLVTMDNYPVNDFAQDRIFLGPYTGREPAVATGSAALLANAPAQPAASRIPLFTAADFAWNPRGYRPDESWKAAVDDLAGGDGPTRDALRALAGNEASSMLGGEESAYLRPLLDDFWTALGGADTGKLGEAADRLRAAFRTMADAPQRLSPALGGELRPWLDQLGRHGRAGQRAVDMLTAQARGDGAAAWQAQLDVQQLRAQIGAENATVGAGVLTPFLDKALAKANGWTGVDRPLRTGGKATDGDPATAVTPPRGAPLAVAVRGPHPLAAVTVLTDPAPGTRGAVEAHDPAAGWQRLGPLSDSGWTQVPGKGVRADGLRLVWDGAAAAPPAVHEIAPWFADTPTADLDLARNEVDTDIGGRPAVVELRMINRRPDTVRERLAVTAPSGVTVNAPAELTVPRGGVTTARIEISVPAGASGHDVAVQLKLAGQERTVTVHAYPPTDGPDLARGGTTASGDGTWQLDLARPVRLGRLVLHWKDGARPARYRVQVSSDGRTWRPAGSPGGTETVRMDVPDVRFVRIEGDKGAALAGVEAYAVR
ncbi:beta-N-acetylglucosaminidase domain-containing protein [Streptomyces sp. NPDC002536]